MGVPHRSVALVICVLLGVIALRAPYFVEPPGRDQSLHMAEAQSLLAGASLYTEVWDHRAPGITLAYTAAMAVAGDSYLAIHLLDALALGAAAALLFLLVERRLRATAPALLACTLYALLAGSVAFGAFWGRAQAEVLMDPLVALAVLLLYGRPDAEAPTLGGCVVAGLALALAILIKYSSLPLALMAVPVLLSRSVLPSARVRSLLAFVSGLLAPGLLALAWFGVTGRLGMFLEATVAFNLAHGGIAALPRAEALGSKIFYQPALLQPLYLLGAAALVGIVVEVVRTHRLTSRPSRLALLGLGLWSLSLGSVFWQGKFWIYQYHVVLLPLCLLAAAGAQKLAGLASMLSGNRRWASAVPLLLAALLSAPILGERRAYAQFHGIIPALRGELERDELLASYRWGDTDYDALQTHLVAEELRRETGPDERLFVWGFEPGIYVEARRRPASRFLFDYPLMPAFGRFHGRFVELLMDDLRMHPPARIVVLGGDANAIEPEESARQLQAIPELQELMSSSYEPAWQLGDFLVLRQVR